MKWTHDGNRLSVHHLKYIIEPKQDFDLYNTGDVGLAVYPGYPGHWNFVILAVGGKCFSLNSDWNNVYLMHVKLNFTLASTQIQSVVEINVMFTGYILSIFVPGTFRTNLCTNINKN